MLAVVRNVQLGEGLIMRTALIGDREFYKEAVRLGAPVAFQSLLVSSASMVDTMMLGSLGESAVSAVGLCSQFIMLMFSAYYGFCNGGTIFFAQFWGVKNDRGMKKAYGLMLTCMMFFGLLFGVLAVATPGTIMRIYTDKEAIQQVGITYLRIVGISLPLQVLTVAMSALLRSTERAKIPLYASILSLLVNTLFNWLLIYGKLGFPQMGVTGAAIATLLSCIVNVVVLYVYCIANRISLILDMKAHFGWELSFVKQYFAKSMFIVMNELFIGIANTIINMVLGRQDASGIAALAVFRVLEGLVFTFLKGLTNASAVIVGKQVGMGAHKKAYADAKRYIALVPVLTCFICLLIQPFSRPLLRSFGLGEQALHYGVQMLWIYNITATVRSCNWISNDNFRAGGDSVYGTVVELICIYGVTIPVLAIGGLVLKLPFIAVFALVFVDDFARIGIILRRVVSGKWIKPVTEEGKQALPEFHKELRQAGHKI